MEERSDAGETGWSLNQEMIDSRFCKDLRDYSGFTYKSVESCILFKNVASGERDGEP